MSILNHPKISPLITDELIEIDRVAKSVINQSLIERHIDPELGVLKRSIWQELASHDLLGMMIPETYGGKGLSILAQLIISDCVKQLNGVAFSLGLHVLNDVTCSWIVHSSNALAKEVLLPKLRSGEILLGTCYTEANKSTPSTLIEDGEGYRLHAKKAFCVNGYNADTYLVDSNLNGKPLTLYVTKDADGVTVEKLHSRIGLEHIDQATIAFNGVYVRKDQILTQGHFENTLAWNNAITKGRLFVGIDAYHCLVQMHQQYEATLQHKKVLGTPLNQYGLYTQVGPALSLTIKKLENEIACIIEKTLNNKNTVLETLRFKEYAARQAIYFGNLCCEMDGGNGYMKDGTFTPLYLDSLGLRFSAGSQVMLRELSSNQYSSVAKREMIR